MSDCGCEFEATNDTQKKVLYWLLAINATMFFLEFGVGWIAQSTALVADSLDMLADAIVYGIVCMPLAVPQKTKLMQPWRAVIFSLPSVS